MKWCYHRKNIKKLLIIHHPSGASFEKGSLGNRVRVKFVFLPFAKEGGWKPDGLKSVNTLNMKTPEIITIAARNLRKNMTKAETVLWNELRYDKLGKRFYRQKPIYVYTENNWLDRFIIADFYSDELKIVIELDWWIHLEKEVLELDREKEKLLEEKWIKVIRFKNEEIFENIWEVLEKIKNYINEK